MEDPPLTKWEDPLTLEVVLRYHTNIATLTIYLDLGPAESRACLPDSWVGYGWIYYVEVVVNLVVVCVEEVEMVVRVVEVAVEDVVIVVVYGVMGKVDGLGWW